MHPISFNGERRACSWELRNIADRDTLKHHILYSVLGILELQEPDRRLWQGMGALGTNGTVTDEFGDPMVRANVMLLHPSWNDGRTVLEQVHQVVTDDRGKFKINNVKYGSYILCSGAGSVEAPSSFQIDFQAHAETRYYA